ncbi:MAG TPA: hypothetical protein VFQ53_24560 [Kofleriaceae bacterium]|nr:hypothetical protein [Kofleriaceae bacterium]
MAEIYDDRVGKHGTVAQTAKSHTGMLIALAVVVALAIIIALFVMRG